MEEARICVKTGRKDLINEIVKANIDGDTFIISLREDSSLLKDIVTARRSMDDGGSESFVSWAEDYSEKESSGDKEEETGVVFSWEATGSVIKTTHVGSRLEELYQSASIANNRTFLILRNRRAKNEERSFWISQILIRCLVPCMEMQKH